jgi:ABC-2 type transport system ATP-binding protein
MHPNDAPVIKTVGLSKSCGRRAALVDLNLEVGRASVFGFLGPNGAGKTTAISVILGLLSPSAGHVELFGLDARAHLQTALMRVGAIVENPAFYPHLTAWDNLRIWGAISGGTRPARIDEVLTTVGLMDRAKDKPRNYSLGMKQRLGLAAALLHDPELLILDEPTNGLDPAGIREFREMFKELARAGKTVFVSSHLLAEVEQMCDEVAIVKEGRLIAQGAVDDLMRRSEALTVRTTDNAQAASLLANLDWVRSIAPSQDGALVIEAPVHRASEVSRVLAKADIWLSELRPQEGSLEEFFLEVTAADSNGG